MKSTKKIITEILKGNQATDCTIKFNEFLNRLGNCTDINYWLEIMKTAVKILAKEVIGYEPMIRKNPQFDEQCKESIDKSGSTCF